MKTVTICLCFIIAVTVGCSGGLTKLEPVSGVVKIADQPASDLLLQFTPVSGQNLTLTGMATSGKDGKFTVSASNGKPGLPVGKYRVTVVDNLLGQEEDANLGKSRKVAVSRVSSKLSLDSTSPIEFSVTAGKIDYEILIPR